MMVDNYYDDLWDIEDPYRKCEYDELKYHEDYGDTCDQCDIWICNNCWPEHIIEHLKNSSS